MLQRECPTEICEKLNHHELFLFLSLHSKILVFYLACFGVVFFFFQYAFANEWVVWVNFWLGLAYHTEETSSYTQTGKIQTRSNDVSLHVHQEESGITPIVPFCSFFPSGFIH